MFNLLLKGPITYRRVHLIGRWSVMVLWALHGSCVTCYLQLVNGDTLNRL